MKIGIANDHRGVEVKQKLIKYLEDSGYNVINYGTNTNESVDYPDFAFKVGEAVARNEIDAGILICNTGIGMSIAANKVKGVRCARVVDEYDAEMTRIDNNANIIALSSRMNVEKLENIVKIFLNTKHDKSERHDRRIEKISNYEY